MEGVYTSPYATENSNAVKAWVLKQLNLHLLSANLGWSSGRMLASDFQGDSVSLDHKIEDYFHQRMNQVAKAGGDIRAAVIAVLNTEVNLMRTNQGVEVWAINSDFVEKLGLQPINIEHMAAKTPKGWASYSVFSENKPAWYRELAWGGLSSRSDSADLVHSTYDAVRTISPKGIGVVEAFELRMRVGSDSGSVQCQARLFMAALVSKGIEGFDKDKFPQLLQVMVSRNWDNIGECLVAGEEAGSRFYFTEKGLEQMISIAKEKGVVQERIKPPLAGAAERFSQPSAPMGRF